MEWLEDKLAGRPGLWKVYCGLNFCKETRADGSVKADGVLFKIFSRVFYLKCACCSAVRGIIFGLLLGAVLWLR